MQAEDCLQLLREMKDVSFASVDETGLLRNAGGIPVHGRRWRDDWQIPVAAYPVLLRKQIYT